MSLNIFPKEWVLPSYDGDCSFNIPATILDIFGIKTKGALLSEKIRASFPDSSEKVMLFLLDGLGNDLWHSCKDFSGFQRISKVGNLKAVFPSTTPVSLNTFNTGLTPEEHGLPELVVYYDEVGTTLYSLSLETVYDVGNISLDSSLIMNSKTVYSVLKKQGVKSYVFLPRDICDTPCSKKSYDGAIRIPYDSVENLMELLVLNFENESGRAYYFVYWSELDSLGHINGSKSETLVSKLRSFFESFDKNFCSKVSGDSLVLFTGDHGMITVDPKKMIFLNKFKGFADFLKTDRFGCVVPPTGSPRNIFVHVKKGKKTEAEEFLKNCLKGDAIVVDCNFAVKNGFFGLGSPSKEFIARIGDLLILPLENKTIWFEGFEGYHYEYKGFHGGLSKEEMNVPLISFNLSDTR